MFCECTSIYWTFLGLPLSFSWLTAGYEFYCLIKFGPVTETETNFLIPVLRQAWIFYELKWLSQTQVTEGDQTFPHITIV